MDNEAYIVSANGGSNYYYLFSMLEYDEVPILFAAKNDSNQLFLCNCVEMRHVQRWIIAQTNYSILKAVVEKKIRVFDALKKISNSVVIAEYDYERNVFTQRLNCDITTLDDSFLPDKDAYLLYPCEDCETQIRLFSVADTNTENVVWTETLLNDGFRIHVNKEENLKQNVTTGSISWTDLSYERVVYDAKVNQTWNTQKLIPLVA